MKLSELEVIEIIERLQRGEGTEAEQDRWVADICDSVPFYEEIITLLFWGDDGLSSSDEIQSAQEIFGKAKNTYQPIAL